MGLGFSRDKKELLQNVLSIQSIFRKGLIVDTDVRQDNSIMRQIVKSEIQSPDTLLRNVEKLALQIHQQYIDTTTAQYEEKKAKNELDDKTREKFESLTDLYTSFIYYINELFELELHGEITINEFLHLIHNNTPHP